MLWCRHKCRHRVIRFGMNHCKVCSVSLSDCSQKRQLGSHTQDSSLCTAQLIRLLCNLGKTEQEAKEYATGYTCKRCFDALQLCTTLKEKLVSAESELNSQLCTSVSALSISRLAAPRPETPCSSSRPGSSKKRKTSVESLQTDVKVSTVCCICTFSYVYDISPCRFLSLITTMRNSTP